MYTYITNLRLFNFLLVFFNTIFSYSFAVLFTVLRLVAVQQKDFRVRFSCVCLLNKLNTVVSKRFTGISILKYKNKNVLNNLIINQGISCTVNTIAMEYTPGYYYLVNSDQNQLGKVYPNWSYCESNPRPLYPVPTLRICFTFV